MRTIVCMLLMGALIFQTAGAQDKSLPKDSILIDGMYRHFFYYAPENAGKGAALLFVIHGATIDGRFMRVLTNMELERIARQENLIVVYPNGYQTFWNGCRKAATYAANIQDLDDAGFFLRMIRFFEAKYEIDTGRVFAAGYSNGGHMCYKLALESPDLFRGFAVFGANLPEDANNDCRATGKPVSMLIINGTADPINPYEGGEIVTGDGEQRGRVMSAAETFDYWKKLAAGAGTAEVIKHSDTDSDDCFAVEQQFQCGDYEISLITIQNGGHTIPHPDVKAWPAFVGTVNRDLNGPQITWNFFKRQ
jgi:polyhydroxybutyrate depolymerase